MTKTAYLTLRYLKQTGREVIVFAKFRGMSYAEIARIVECSEMAVKTRVFRAMEMLKRKLVDEAGGGEKCLTAS